VGADFTFLSLEAQEREPFLRHEYRANGPGDTTIGAVVRIDLWERRGVGGDDASLGPGATRLLLGADLVLPTGLSTLHYEETGTGRRVYFPPQAQLGAGIWRPRVSCTALHRFEPLHVFALAGYSYGRMANAVGLRRSDALDVGFGLLGRLSQTLDLRGSAAFLLQGYLHDLRMEDPDTGAYDEIDGTGGWLALFEAGLSIGLGSGFHAEAGMQVPLWKTLEDSPNDLDGRIYGGIEWRF
jgi:hypothetical protein